MTTAPERTRSVIYPVRRAAERCVALPGVRPLRVFATLFPLWQVEIRAQVHERQRYDLVDKFVARAIAECGIGTAAGLTEFLGLDRSFVDRVLHFLDLIGHIEWRGESAALTELGRQSLRDDARYVRRESRQKLLFDAISVAPLPRAHYAGDIELLTEPRYTSPSDRTEFQALAAHAIGGGEFHPDAVQRLAARADRAQFNVPNELRDISILRVSQVYLPVYLVAVLADGRPGHLAFSQVAGEQDAVLERLVADTPAIQRLLDAEDQADSAALWGTWLERRGLPARTLARLPGGGWRATLPGTQFGEGRQFPRYKLGSFEVSRRHFLQLWCADVDARRATVHERGLALLSRREVATRADLLGHLGRLARQLEVDPVDVAALRAFAERTSQHDRVRRIDALPDH